MKFWVRICPYLLVRRRIGARLVVLTHWYFTRRKHLFIRPGTGLQRDNTRYVQHAFRNCVVPHWNTCHMSYIQFKVQLSLGRQSFFRKGFLSHSTVSHPFAWTDLNCGRHTMYAIDRSYSFNCSLYQRSWVHLSKSHLNSFLRPIWPGFWVPVSRFFQPLTFVDGISTRLQNSIIDSSAVFHWTCENEYFLLTIKRLLFRYSKLLSYLSCDLLCYGIVVMTLYFIHKILLPWQFPVSTLWIMKVPKNKHNIHTYKRMLPL